MTRQRWLAGYGLTALLFLALDASWLATTADRLYRPALSHLLAPQFALLPALLFYASYIGGIVGFALAPALAAGRARIALQRGAALGLLAYATYDLTNQSTLRDWPWSLTLVDLAWGSFATGVAPALAALLMLRLRRSRSAPAATEPAP